MADAIVLYPAAGAGHLGSMVELAKLIVQHYPSFSITIILAPSPPPLPNPSSTFTAAVSTAYPAITFLHLPDLHPLSFSEPDIPTRIYESAVHNNSNLQQALADISKSSVIVALIIDFFCTPAMEVSSNFEIPTHFFFTTCANALATILHYPTIDKSIPGNLKDWSDKVIEIPGLPAIRAADLPEDMQDRTRNIYKYFLNIGKKLAESAGIIVNSFDLLEKRAVKAIREGKVPPLYCIGPVIGGGGDGEHECLSWLDSQPSRSVLFLSFGSMGRFPVKQLHEMAKGLENSGVRFLWVVRNPPPENPIHPTPEPTLESIMPKGFLERTKGKGFVLKSWAPQVAILNHESVGGFVTHCGWNSVLESVCAGVPMLAWPLYAEQRLNRVFLVEEMKVALAISMPENGFVTALELEKAVNQLMTESEQRKAIRQRASIMRDGAVAAMTETGSSRVALAELAESFTKGLI